MSRESTEMPDRLLAGDATDFERRVIDSALEKRPSAAASARMARALGVTVTTVGTAAAAKALAAEAASKATVAAAATSTSWPLVSVGVLGLVVAGAVVGVRARHTTPAAPVSPPAALTAPAPPAAPRAPALPVADVQDQAPGPAKVARRSHAAPAGSDLRDEIAVVDAARGALSGGEAQRALDILRRYEAKYTAGSFRPEATAIRIEALVKLGRQSEARALATRFVAEQRGTLLANRVADLVGLTGSPPSP
jgi:hypothetical protein